MNQITIPFCDKINKASAIGDIAHELDHLAFTPLAEQPWREYPYKPACAFAIAHADDCIFLKYKVIEKHLRAVHGRSNEDVYKDSCVEFFFSPDGNDHYYNLEFNCIGTCKAAYGPSDRQKRRDLSDALIDRIQRASWMRRGNAVANGLVNWELSMLIPVEVFEHHSHLSLKGLKATANFYKCGDELPEPHFIAWNGIKTPKPDYHRPDFFGKIDFL